MHNIVTIYSMKFTRFVNFNLLIVALIVTLSLSLLNTVQAQNIPAANNTITLTASTNNPLPGQSITITAASYSFNINGATVIWSIGGKQVQKGIGLITYQATAPALGKKLTIDVNAITPDGGSYSNSIILGSGVIDMIMETDGYTPPFFKGKFPLVFQNTVKIIAVPHLANSAGKEYDPATLVYNWKKDDGTVLGNQSGYGKQSISIKGSIIPRPYSLIVTASTRDGMAQAQSLIQIAPTSPSIIFYDNDPLYGPLFNNAINSSFHIGSQNELGVFASLFGFNFSNKITDALNLNWMINNLQHSELSSSQSVTLRATNGTSGVSHIDLAVKGNSNILQSAESSFDVSFDASGSTAQSVPVNF